MKQRSATKQPQPTPVAPLEDNPYADDAAGFWRRLSGFIVDVIISFGIPSVGSSLIMLALDYSRSSIALDVIWMLVLGVIVLAYFTVFAMRGSSPGMRMAGVKIVDVRTGEAPDLAHSLIRGGLVLVLIGSWFFLILLGSYRGTGDMSRIAAILLNIDYVVFLVSFFGHVWIAWDKKRQTLQDKVAGVIVLRKDATIEPDRRPTRAIDPLEWRM